jgi:hypothetical protein
MVTGHFRLEAKIIGRKAKDRNGHAIPGRQSSVVAKAAYRSGQMLHDERAEKTFNYRSRTQEVAYSEILAPEVAADWLKGGGLRSFGKVFYQRVGKFLCLRVRGELFYPALAGYVPRDAIKRVIGFLAVDFALGFAVPDDFRKLHGCRFNFRFSGILCGICAVTANFLGFPRKNGRGGGI